MNLPRVLNDSGNVSKIIHPVHVSLDLAITPLSYASIKLPKEENLTARSYVELFTPFGSAGVFRVRSPQDAYGDEITSAELEHAIAEVGDFLVKEKISEMMNADAAIKKVFSHYKGSKWKLGSVTALGSGKVAVSVNYTRVLDSMLAILEQKRDCMMAFDFTTKPWTVSIVKKGTTVQAEGRLSRNVTSAVVSYDDTELCTRVWYETYKKKGGSVESEWKYKDADTKSKYGLIEREVSTSSDMTDEEINVVVDTFIAEHKNPRVAVSIEGVELSQITGESMDKFTIGKLFRLVIPEYNVVLQDNIVGLSWSDLYGNPMGILVNVGDQEDTVVSFLHNLDAKGSGGGGGSGGAKKLQEEKEKEYWTEFYKDDYYVSLNANHIDRVTKILDKAGLDINAKGVLIYASGSNTIGSRFEVTQKAITLKADKIELDGYVKAKDLTAAFFKSKISQLDVVSATSITTTGGITAYGTLGSSVDIKIGATSLKNAIISASVSDNVLTLKDVNGNTTTFSKATTLTGAWSGGIYKVTASPQGNTLSSGMLQNGEITRSGNYIDIKVNAGDEYTGKTLTVKWTDYLSSASMTQHQNATGTKNFTAYYLAPDGSTYVSMGQHYWYHSGSNIGSRSVYY